MNRVRRANRAAAVDQQLDEQRTGSVLNSSSTSQFQYDLNGDRILETKVQGASTLLATYLWDPSNRLAVVQDLGYVLTNTYRPDGLRHRTVDNFSANVMIRDKNDVLATVDDTGALVQFFTRGARAVKRYNSPSSAMFYHCDALGTMQAYSKPDGTTFERVVLDAWGGNTQAMGVDVHSYVGDAGYWGVGGLHRPLYYVRARWLVAGGPGWLSPDPLGAAGRGPNLYRYVGNRPGVATDPSGQFSLIGLLLGGFVCGGACLGAVWPGIQAYIACANQGMTLCQSVFCGLEAEGESIQQQLAGEGGYYQGLADVFCLTCFAVAASDLVIEGFAAGAGVAAEEYGLIGVRATINQIIKILTGRAEQTGAIALWTKCLVGALVATVGLAAENCATGSLSSLQSYLCTAATGCAGLLPTPARITPEDKNLVTTILSALCYTFPTSILYSSLDYER